MAITEKLTRIFNVCLTGARVPEYMRTGRIFCLSKEATEYPTVGAIRTIFIAPTITKTYELALLQHLQIEMSRLNALHESQRGFRDKCSTFENLVDLFAVMKGSL